MDVDLSVAPPGTPAVSADVDDELAAVEENPFAEDDLVADDPVDEATVRNWLEFAGRRVGGLAGDADVDDHWHFTEAELDELAPPLTRYVNRRARLRALVRKGDGVIVGSVLLEYVQRNRSDARAAKEARGEHIERQGPRVGAPAPRLPDWFRLGGRPAAPGGDEDDAGRDEQGPR